MSRSHFIRLSRPLSRKLMFAVMRASTGELLICLVCILQPSYNSPSSLIDATVRTISIDIGSRVKQQSDSGRMDAQLGRCSW